MQTMVYARPGIVLENETFKLLRDFEIHTDLLISARLQDQGIIKNKKIRTCLIADFANALNHREKIKENDNRDKYLDFAEKLKNLYNMQVTVIPIIVVALGTIPKSLEKDRGKLEIKERVETSRRHHY